MAEIYKITSGQDKDKKYLSVALFSSNAERRRAMSEALSARTSVRIREFTSLPARVDEFVATLGQNYDAVLLDVDSDPEAVFDLTSRVSYGNRAYVMACSAKADMKQAVRFMRAGAREFFTLPLDAAEVAGALNRAMEEPQGQSPAVQIAGKLLVFLGTKGGCGVTTLASNFALLLAQESEQNTLLIDVGQPLGDVAINLGIRTEYSVINALMDPDRLDSSFLNSLVAKHSSGLNVLAAPSEFPEGPFPREAFERTLSVARQSYDWVVVDAGSRVDLIGTALFEMCSTIYLVTQVGISELRNANRMITQFFSTRDSSLQIVLNRYTQRALLFDDAQIAKTLTRPAQWKIPNDYSAVRKMQINATPLALADSPISRLIKQMARAAIGQAEQQPTKKKGFSLFG